MEVELWDCSGDGKYVSKIFLQFSLCADSEFFMRQARSTKMLLVLVLDEGGLAVTHSVLGILFKEIKL